MSKRHHTMQASEGQDRFGRPYTEKTSSDTLIRLQQYVDEDIPSDRADLGRKLSEVRNILTKHHTTDGREGNVELYSRTWVSSSQQHSANATESVDEYSEGVEFTVAQFNTLAKGLSSGPNHLFPTPFHTDSKLHEGSYGGFTELSKPEIILDFDQFRKWRLLEVMLGGEDAFNSSDDRCIPAYDILALDEVDEYHSFFEPILVKDGHYCGIYQPKPYSPCVRLGWYSDGVALLWRTEKFEVIYKTTDADGDEEHWVEKGAFEGENESQNQVYIILPLQIKEKQKCIVVAATHLKAKGGITNEQIRQSQALEIRRRSEQMAEQLKEFGWKDVSIIILGDFNTEADTEAVRSILRDDCNRKFQSAYALDNDSYTTWKTRKNGTIRRVIDYIFHTHDKGLHCKQVLSVPPNEELESTYLPGFCYPSDHLLIAAKFHVNVDAQQNLSTELSGSPFEWLTNFQSLRHLVLPSSIVGDMRPPSVESASYTPKLNLNALHVGCGTSTVGESLLCLREKEFDGYQLQYGHVVNVDIDRDALDVMQHRWRQRQLQTQGIDNIGLGVMDWRYLDFKCEESCRLALDPFYQSLSQTSPSYPHKNLGGYFDLVLDKSTLDCLLCSETDVVANFLCEVYRALKVPNPASDHPHGGVYVLITFHPVDFIQHLLSELPGAHLDITYEVIKRKADIVNSIDALEVEEVVSGTNQLKIEHETTKELPTASSAWSSGSFNPDENYRKTITVFTCRRKLNSTQETSNQTYTLDRQQVREHIESTCDKWYQTASPMVTNEREATLREDFQKAVMSQHGAESTLDEDVLLDLKTCYEVMFTEEEKQVLSYDYFIEDWEAYCQNESRGEEFPRQGMTIQTAIDFLQEMQ